MNPLRIRYQAAPVAAKAAIDALTRTLALEWGLLAVGFFFRFRSLGT